MEDHFGHRISYLRVSVTDRCNERCAYCMPQELQEWLPRPEILSYEETLRLIRIAADLGVTKIRITGGEPLTRRDIVDFIRQVPRIPGIRDVGVSTNGTLLAREIAPNLTTAGAVRAVGVRSLNISLDTLDRNVYAQITGRDFLPAVFQGIEASVAAGFEQIKLNTVLMRGCNELRVTCDGKLRPCLGSYLEFDIIKPMRDGATDDELRQFFLDVVDRKPQQHDFRENYQPNRKMIAIGG